jgi:CHASE2 domain-containing sensor protein
MYLGTWLGEHDVWIDLRYRIYQSFEWLSPHPPKPTRTAVVLIDDEEYWKGRPAHRAPIRRDYLSELVIALDKCDPAVIALDFDLRSPVTDGSMRESPEYLSETNKLTETVNAVSGQRPVILGATVNFDAKGRYITDGAIYDGLKLSKGKVQTGYINLPYDVRQVPVAQLLATGCKLDSFSESIVRAVNQDLLTELDDDTSLPYGTFMAEETFTQVLAADVLKAQGGEVCAPLRHNIVIVGASWHQDAFNRGPWADTFTGPLGKMKGAFLHANYTEALLTARTYRPLGDQYSLSLEFLFSVAVAVLLSLEIEKGLKFWLVGLSCLLVMAFSYFFWQNLGIFFDFFFPVMFLLAHVYIEHVREQEGYKQDALKWRESQGPS